MQRRSFLRSILAAGVAPAFVGASVLMPIRAIAPAWTPLDMDEIWAAVHKRLASDGERMRALYVSDEMAIKHMQSRLYWPDQYVSPPMPGYDVLAVYSERPTFRVA